MANKKMICYHIDVQNRTVTPKIYTGLRDLQALVGGSIAFAARFKSGDVIFVDDEGLLKPTFGSFLLPGTQPFAGNGVMVGREIGDTANTLPPTMTVEELRKKVKFITEEELKAWAATQRDEPFISVIAILDGKAETSVVQTKGDFFKDREEILREKMGKDKTKH